MNFDFVWKAVHVANNEIRGIYQQTVYGQTLVEAVQNWTAMHGDLWEDETGYALEITPIKEVK